MGLWNITRAAGCRHGRTDKSSRLGRDKDLLSFDAAESGRNALTEYRKAADRSNCMAMMNIGGLYFNVQQRHETGRRARRGSIARRRASAKIFSRCRRRRPDIGRSPLQDT